MSSNLNSITPLGSSTETENFQNFENLPFHFHFQIPLEPFSFSPFHTAFLQLPINHNPPTPTHRYRDNSFSSSH